MFSKTWKVNLRIIYDLPRETHCWIVEQLTGGTHLLQMIYSRFCKYIQMVRKNKRAFLRDLYGIVKDDIRTTSGSNIRTILLSTGVDPRYQNKHKISGWCAYPPQDSWTVPLLTSLMELRSENWEVDYDDEDVFLQPDEINVMIEAITTG